MLNITPKMGEIDVEGAYILHYDGGCQKNQGSGGYGAW